jgi:integrase
MPWSGVSLVRTKHSGRMWQFRAWVKAEGKYLQKSLRTRSLSEAIELANDIVLDLRVKQKAGERVFAITIDELAKWYIESREEDVSNRFITAGRLTTIRSQLKHLVAFIGSGTKLNNFKGEDFRGYQSWRREKSPTVKIATIQNEQSTINHVMRMALDEGLSTHHQAPKWGRKFKAEVSRRDAFEPEEYQTLYRAFPGWIRERKDEDENYEKRLVRDFILVAANTGLRFGELRQLRWHMVTRIFTQEGKNHGRPFVELNLPAEITKNRKSRQVIGAGGQFFQRIKTYSQFKGGTDFVFSDRKTRKQFPSKLLYRHWDDLMAITGLIEKPRKPTFYCLRHTYATFRLMYGEVNPFLLSQNMGCTVTFLEQHYGHVRTPKMVDALTRIIEENRDAFDMVE